MKTKMKIGSVFGMFLALGLLASYNVSNAKSVHADIVHGHDEVDFDAWTSGNTMPDVAGDYFLDNNVTLEAKWVVPEGTTNLCLNGKVLSMVDDPGVTFEIEVGDGCTLNIYDCDTTTQHYFTEDGENTYWILDDTLEGEDRLHTLVGGVITAECHNAIFIKYGGEVNFYNGNIAGCEHFGSSGSCIYIEGGSCNFYDGCMCGCYSSQGAVNVCLSEYPQEYPGLFNMYGGTISDNIADGLGGGLCVIGGNANMYDGLITRNSAGYTGGGVDVEMGQFNMYGGTITDNVASSGGGVSCGLFTEAAGYVCIHDGEISNNHAIEIPYENSYPWGVGGGIFVCESSSLMMDGGVVKDNIADIAGGGVYLNYEARDAYYCVAEGTPILLRDGTTTPIEELKVGDNIAVVDNYYGTIKESEVYYLEKSENVSEDVFTLHFEDGINITCVGGHSFFSEDDNKFVTLTPSNVANYVGKNFYNAKDQIWEGLVSYTIETEPVTSYSIVSNGYINVITNKMVSVGDGIYTVMANVFDFSSTPLKVDQDQKSADIDQYGTYSYTQMTYVTNQTFYALELQYLPVAIGKGMITPEQIEAAGQYQEANGSTLVRQRKGTYFGGDVKIYGNASTEELVTDNVYMWTGEVSPKVYISDGNYICGDRELLKAPEEGMCVGITLAVYNDDESVELVKGAFTNNGSEDDVRYFFADDEDNMVIYKNGHLELSKLLVAKPNADTRTFIYNGSEQTYEITENNKYYVIDNVKSEAGTYTVTVILNDKDNDTWMDGTTDDLTYEFVINKAQVEKPYEDTTTFRYNGQDQTYFIEENEAYIVMGNVQKDTGNYIVKVALHDIANYEWSDGTTEDVDFTYTINRAQIDKPSADTTTFTYNGQNQTYTIAENDAYTVTGNVKKDVGTYTVTVALKDKDNYEWSDGTTEDLTYEFVINNVKVDKPSADTTTFTYNGQNQTYTIAENDAYTVTGNVKKDAGTYKVKVVLNDKDNYSWSDGTTDDLEYDFVINKAKLDKPTADTNKYTWYRNAQRTYNIASNDNYTVTNNKQTNAGTYDVVVSLNDKDNYSWNDGTTEDLHYSFEIEKGKVVRPAEDTRNFVYNGEYQSYNISDNDPIYTVTNGTEKKPGVYDVVVSLCDKNNSTWDDGSTDDLHYSFVINQKAEDVKVVDENKQEIASPVAEIVEGVNGIKPEAVLVVKVIEVTDNTLIESSKQVLENNNKLSDEEKIYGLYDAKLILDNVEVQPDGMIKIKMLVPEEMQGKDFKVFHIHAGSEVYELEYSLSNNGKYITIETDKLSQFAFVAEAPKLDICIIHWFLIALLVIGIACFVVFEFVLKKEMYAIISSGACLLISDVLMFFNGCTICTVFTILNTVIFVGMIVYLFIAKNKKESE